MRKKWMQMDLAAERNRDSLMKSALIAGWLILCLVTILAYLPGLDGPFLLDDFGSIAPLGDLGGVVDWMTFKAFVFGGHAGPTGRPLSLLTFLIDANNWPADPWAFKRTNLIIHIVSGVLLGILIGKILSVLKYDTQNARWIALVAAGIWLLHPFLVSTTLYAVQRMAQLSTLFIFAGLIGHLYGRSKIARDASKAYLIMSLSMGLFTLLAVLSKENGILLPLLIGVVELTVFSTQKNGNVALNRYWAWAFVVAPSIIIFLYLARTALTHNFFDISPPRDFSIYERVLTQPRILFDYLQNWFVPKLYTSGIFQDHFAKSTGFFSPFTTALSMVLHVAVVSVAIMNRHKWPLFALAALFFYASHILESTVMNLELYFEHRNYLPVAFLFVPLVTTLRKRVGAKLFMVTAVFAMLVLAGFTRYSATVWSDYSSMIEVAARKAPMSARAQGQYATDLYNAQRYDESLSVVARAIENNPQSAFLYLAQTNILCGLGVLDDDELKTAAQVISNTPYDPRSISIYTTLTSSVVAAKCPGVSLDAVQAMFKDMLRVPENANPQSLRYSQIQYFIGFIDAFADRPSQAVAAFEASLRARPGAGHAMMMAAVMATNEFHNEALHLSDLALSQLRSTTLDPRLMERIRESDIREFRATVQADRDAELAKDQAEQ
jgi:tetratricopeptide (TPR) repeat protein